MDVKEFSDATGLDVATPHLVLAEADLGVDRLNLIIKKIGDRSGGYAILDEDFPALLECSKSVAMLVAGIEVKVWVPIAVASAVHLMLVFRKKRVPITALQALILKELKDTPSVTVEQLASGRLSELVTHEELLSELQKLTDMRRHDGTLVQLVQRDDAERWTAVDV